MHALPRLLHSASMQLRGSLGMNSLKTQCSSPCQQLVAGRRAARATPARALRAFPPSASLGCSLTSREFHKSVCSPSVRGPASRKQVVARANWGAPVEFTSAKVLRNREVTPQAHQVFVDVGSLATGYTKPGQFIQAKVDPEGKPGFFAIASPPDVNNQGVLELLVKRQPGSAADAICDLQEGSELKVSPVMGKGFPVDQIPAASFPTVLMFATGSGISPIKAVIESGVLEVSKRKDVRLYYGTKSEDATPYLELIPAWNALGVKVNLVHSGDSKNYVQDAFSKDPKKLEDPASVGVLLVGQKDMCQAVTGMLKEQGVQQIMLNF